MADFFLPKDMTDPLRSAVRTHSIALVTSVFILGILTPVWHYFELILAFKISLMWLAVVVVSLLTMKMGFHTFSRGAYFACLCAFSVFLTQIMSYNSFMWVYLITSQSISLFVALPGEKFLRKVTVACGIISGTVVVFLFFFRIFTPELDPETPWLIYFRIFNVCYCSGLLMMSVLRYQGDVVKYKQQLEQQAVTMLQQAKMSSLGDMAGSMAHEINIPLEMILGQSSQLLKETGSSNPNMQVIAGKAEKIQFTVSRIAKIVSSLRTFSRNAEEDPFQNCKFAEIMDDTMNFCGEKFRANHIEIRVRGDQNLQLQCRPTQISQVLISVFSNSFDAVHNLSEKWMDVHFEARDNTLAIRVIDSGKGIPAEVAEKIMQPFFSTKENGKGTGLGLSTSRDIVETHGGKIYLDPSCPNTCFVIELPISQAIQQTPAA